MSRSLVFAPVYTIVSSVLGLGLIAPPPSLAGPLEHPDAAIVAQAQKSSTRWPGNRIGGGTRGCEIIPGTPSTLSPLKQNFIALTPQTNLGVTTLPYPQVAWYMPPSSVRYAELELTTEEDMLIYRTTFRIDGKGGIYSLTLPSNAGIPPLEMNKSYRWALYVYCQSNDDTLDPSFNFGVDLGRTNVSSYISRQPAQGSPTSSDWIQKVQTDLKDNIWLDALNTLFTEYCAAPENKNFMTQWKQALDAIDLGELADEPLRVSCPQKH